MAKDAEKDNKEGKPFDTRRNLEYLVDVFYYAVFLLDDLQQANKPNLRLYSLNLPRHFD